MAVEEPDIRVLNYIPGILIDTDMLAVVRAEAFHTDTKTFFDGMSVISKYRFVHGMSQEVNAFCAFTVIGIIPHYQVIAASPRKHCEPEKARSLAIDVI